MSKSASVLIGRFMSTRTQKTRARAEGGSKEGRFYKPLPKEFRRGEFNYRQICREGDFAIYQQTWKGNDDSAAFEVIRIRRREGFQIGDRLVESGEFYPSSESWGSHGFTVTDKDVAFEKLRELQEAGGRSAHWLAAPEIVQKSPT
jgi:hypothetical protein